MCRAAQESGETVGGDIEKCRQTYQVQGRKRKV